ncbi:uncharacterized protein LOC128743106 [Sabethes cyaneus]|uniref:uncharacterized protein LOC128743106 n=1 Tax=Sabethes cyaneus TaxID=53552 RepID=UPI00237D9416|nr:uncharacterized protein LOC128743106 [Sabethes cyaneus]
MRHILFFLSVLISQSLFSVAQTYKCTIEATSTGDEHCVFRNVQLSSNTTNVSFELPTSGIPSRVTFKNSSLVHIPADFIQKFGDTLKVLYVEGCMLRSVIITNNLEVLHARNNYISRVVTQHNGNTPLLRDLDLSANRLKDIRNITHFKNLEILNLSSNEEIAAESVIDLNAFAPFKNLKELYLSDVGAFYLEYNKKFNLPTLQTLDLSKNTLLPSDLRVNRLSELEALEVLKLNDNNMAELDYGQLPYLKSLRRVYLNGNNFLCDKLQTMLKFLHERSITTPADTYSSCQPHQQQVDGMCCTKPIVMPPRPTQVPTLPTHIDSTDMDNTDNRVDMDNTDNRVDDQTPGIADNSNDGFPWIAVAIAVPLAIVLAGVGLYVYRKHART